LRAIDDHRSRTSKSINMNHALRESGLAGRFKLWEYRVSHRQLLLRRFKRDGASRNLDLMFHNVSYLDLPTDEVEFEVDEPSSEDVVAAEIRTGGGVPKENLFILKCAGRRHIVVAGDAVYEETDMGVFESPFALPPVNLHIPEDG
jgi:hypothetical protein